MHTKKELDQIFLETGLKPNKKLGQNFLVNPTIVEKLVDKVKGLAQMTKAQSLVEIGPGLGALTDDLKRLDLPLLLVEFDTGLAEYWSKKGFHVEQADALQVNWQELLEKFKIPTPTVLVSNLPYQIAASIVMETGVQENAFSAMVLMFQKEVAQRISAKQGDTDYGLLSVVAQSQWKIGKVVDAGPQDFHPVPNVGSRVLAFERRPENERPAKGFVEFAKKAFSHPRKKLISNLQAGYSRDLLNEIWPRLTLPDNARAEELSVAQFQRLFSALHKGNPDHTT